MIKKFKNKFSSVARKPKRHMKNFIKVLKEKTLPKFFISTEKLFKRKGQKTRLPFLKIKQSYHMINTGRISNSANRSEKKKLCYVTKSKSSNLLGKRKKIQKKVILMWNLNILESKCSFKESRLRVGFNTISTSYRGIKKMMGT